MGEAFMEPHWGGFDGGVLMATNRGGERSPGPRVGADEPVHTPEGADGFLERLSQSQLERFGQRRTAYPRDMTLKELVDRRLAVGTRVVERSAATARGTSLRRLVDQALSGPGPAVLLGLPGSGKSMSMYQMAVGAAGRDLLPILVRVIDMDRMSAVLTELSRPARGGQPPLLLLDGLDEGLALWKDADSAPRVLIQLLSEFPAVVTSRTRDFEETSALERAGITFERMYELQPWTIEREFKSFIDRLVAKRLLPDRGLMDSVRGSEDLQRLASRPLHARMLTFLYEPETAVQTPTSQKELYSQYLQKLARVARRGLAARGCSEPDPLEFWKRISWEIYTANAVTHDISTLIRATQVPDGLRECGIAALDAIADRHDSRGYSEVEYLHYSFYEWLVAAYVRDKVVVAHGTATTSELLKYDLPREIRHYLTSQLDSAREQLTEHLVDTYRSLRTGPMRPAEVLVASNLIIYLIARSSPVADSALATIAATETEPFLSNALLWSMCHLGNSEALIGFAAKYRSSPEWREISRGYVLYYYGDLAGAAQPPYRDAEPFVDAGRSVTRVLSMMADREYTQTVAQERQAVDMMTVLDILSVRGLTLSSRQARVVLPLTESLRASGIPRESGEVLDDLITNVIMEGETIDE